jgi:hypothetical protein
VSSENPIEPTSGGKYQTNDKLGVTTLAYHRASVYLPFNFTGGEYMFYAFLKNQVNAMDAWKLEVRERGKLMEIRRGRGSSMNFVYKTSTCTKNQDCGLDRICVFNQCIQDGTPRFTLLWEGNSTFDLSVKPPNGLMISHDHVYDSSSGGLYEDNSKYPNHSHVQSVSFGGTNLAIGGHYHVYLTNNDMSSWTLKVFVYGILNQTFMNIGSFSHSWYYDFAPYLVLPLNE